MLSTVKKYPKSIRKFAILYEIGIAEQIGDIRYWTGSRKVGICTHA